MSADSAQLISSRERFRGFVYALAAFAVLEAPRFLFTSDTPLFVVDGTSLFGGVIFFIALFSWSNTQYKYYAQGALLGWLVYLLLAMGIRFLLR